MLGRRFQPLTYTQDDAAGLTLLEPAPRTVRGARDLISVALQEHEDEHHGDHRHDGHRQDEVEGNHLYSYTDARWL